MGKWQERRHHKREELARERMRAEAATSFPAFVHYLRHYPRRNFYAGFLVPSAIEISFSQFARRVVITMDVEPHSALQAHYSELITQAETALWHALQSNNNEWISAVSDDFFAAAKKLNAANDKLKASPAISFAPVVAFNAIADDAEKLLEAHQLSHR